MNSPTASRELAEEVGLVAEHIELLGEFYNSPGFCDEHSFTYLATGLTSCDAAPVGPEEEVMEIVHFIRAGGNRPLCMPSRESRNDTA